MRGSGIQLELEEMPASLRPSRSNRSARAAARAAWRLPRYGWPCRHTRRLHQQRAESLTTRRPFDNPGHALVSCSCPDWADMCKHVAAVLYGVGARLDERPELLFVLRGVEERDLLASAGAGLPLAKTALTHRQGTRRRRCGGPSHLALRLSAASH